MYQSGDSPRLSSFLCATLYDTCGVPSCPPPGLLRQPCRIEEQESLIIERKVVYCGGPIRLEKGIGRDVNPLELIGQAALDVGTDRLALRWLQRAAPLQHQRFQVGIVHAHIVRLPTFEEAH